MLRFLIYRYQVNVDEPHRFAVRAAYVSSLGAGFAQSAILLLYALAFWYAGELVASGLGSALWVIFGSSCLKLHLINQCLDSQ
jgi:hypothetical protein